MNYGLYLSASGVLTNMYRQDVYANNLANVQTVGFKPDVPVISQRPAEADEGSYPSQFHNALLDQIGGGALAGKQTLNLTPGPIRHTGNPTDVALTTANAFFAVQAKDAQGQSAVRLTRDGRFMVNAQGNLVTATDGLPVLGKDNQPITLKPNAPVTIGRSGQIYQDGQAVAQLQVTAVSDPRNLVKEGQDLLWSQSGADMRTPLANPTVVPEAVEGSGVDPIHDMMNLMATSKAISMNADMLHFEDDLMNQAVNVLGRVS